jgi:glyoxylase-like metal-dependent hydrolase (beta-lactamase superfamily II)
LRIIPVPGHTQGSCALWFRETFLFTGDHLAYSQRRAHLYAFRDACWHSWREQLGSMEKLRSYPCEWVLPGHGRRLHLGKTAMSEQLETCIRWMRDQL